MIVTDAGHDEVAHVHLVAHVERGDVERDRGRHVGGQRLDRDREQHLLEQAAVLHAFGFALEVQRHFGRDRLVGTDAHEVDVHERALHRVALDLPGERELRRRSLDLQRDHRVRAAATAEDVLQLARAGRVTDIVSVPRP